MNLLSEALKISEELDGVVFVGAIAVLAHTGRGRQTHDIDLALASPISELTTGTSLTIPLRSISGTSFLAQLSEVEL